MRQTYFVSGFMRTGTSMMMKALEAGGLKAVYNANRDRMNTQYGDKFYKPNSGGFYELSREQYWQPGFPRMHEGKLIKSLWGGIIRIVSGNYLIVFMLRDPEEIRQSYQAFFGNQLSITGDAYIVAMNDVISILQVRRDVSLTVMNYRDVIDDPSTSFALLKKSGWPIEVEKAAGVVTPSACRFRRERLEIGIR